MKITAMYFLPFHIDTAYPVDEQGIKGFHFDASKMSASDQEFVLGVMTKIRICRGRFNTKFVRMRVDTINPKSTFWMDGDGCVRHNREEYYVKPGPLLRLHQTLYLLWEQKEDESRKK